MIFPGILSRRAAAGLKPGCMNTQTVLQIARETAAGLKSFPDGVRELVAAGVESYHADYLSLTKTFYGVDGSALAAPILFEGLPPVAERLVPAALKAALVDSQSRGQKYRDFSRRAMEAGVHGYIVFPRGGRVLYFGRDGEQHLEWFPGAAPRNAAA